MIDASIDVFRRRAQKVAELLLAVTPTKRSSPKYRNSAITARTASRRDEAMFTIAPRCASCAAVAPSRESNVPEAAAIFSYTCCVPMKGARSRWITHLSLL